MRDQHATLNAQVVEHRDRVLGLDRDRVVLGADQADQSARYPGRQTRPPENGERDTGPEPSRNANGRSTTAATTQPCPRPHRTSHIRPGHRPAQPSRHQPAPSHDRDPPGRSEQPRTSHHACPHVKHHASPSQRLIPETLRPRHRIRFRGPPNPRRPRQTAPSSSEQAPRLANQTQPRHRSPQTPSAEILSETG